jgi:hypothetical protein
LETQPRLSLEAFSIRKTPFKRATESRGGYGKHHAKKNRGKWPNFEIWNGLIPVPMAPGMGLEFDPYFLKKAIALKLA